MKTIQTSKAPAPIGPYSQGVLVNNFLFISGQIALHPQTGELVNQNIEAETRQALSNIEAILQKANITWQNVVKCEIFLTNIQNFAKVNVIYNEILGNATPARQVVEVSALPKGANIEISCIATINDSESPVKS
jgi:2-iminobutanoate/2-iminopropanoate deaminase